MNCKDCDGQMEFIGCNDDPNEGYAYNIYHCANCMVILKNDVWNNAGNLWIDKDNKITIIPLEKE